MLRLNVFELIARTVEIRIVDEPEFGPMSIELSSENKKYLVTLLEGTDDGSDVRIFGKPTATPEMIDILGSSWGARSITEHFGLVVMTFK